MKNLFIKFLALLGFATSAVAGDIVLKEGECWSYATRAGEENSFLVIRKIETLPKIGEVIHISIYGLKIPNPSAPHGYSNSAGHLPIKGSSVRDSLKAKIDKGIPEENWQKGYRTWRDAYDAGKAGVFTISVSECVGVVQEAFKRANKS